MALTDKLTNIADAIRGKTGKTDPLTLDGMATEIAGIETGGGGSMETGELTITSYSYSVSVPVSSKKTHIVIYPKNPHDLMQAIPVNKRTYFLFGVDGEVNMGSTWNSYNADTDQAGAGAVWYGANSTTQTFTFTSTEINIKVGNSAFQGGTYVWFAW